MVSNLEDRIKNEFEKILKIPISTDEIKRYKDNLLRQNPSFTLLKEEEIFKISERQHLTFTPIQVIRLWEKSNNLIKFDKKYNRRQELSELLACALFAAYLNNIYRIDNIPEVPFSTFQSALFNIQLVPKDMERPDIYLQSRSHLNHVIPNIGEFEYREIEVLDYDLYTYKHRSSIISFEHDIADHIGIKKITKRNKFGKFPYTESTRLIVHINQSIDTSLVNFEKVKKYVYPFISTSLLDGTNIFKDIFLVQFFSSELEDGKVIKIFPDYEYQLVNIKKFTYYLPTDYFNPIFDIY